MFFSFQGLKPTVMEAPAPVFDSSRTKPAQVPAFMSVAASETGNGGVMPKAAAYVKIQNLQSSMTVMFRQQPVIHLSLFM